VVSNIFRPDPVIDFFFALSFQGPPFFNVALVAFRFSARALSPGGSLFRFESQ